MTEIRKKSTNWLSLSAFILTVLGLGYLVGFVTRPAEWYMTLVKPPLNPPSWLFAPVWTALYVCIAVAGYRVWQISPNGNAMKIWFVQMVLNFAWSPIFFLAHNLIAALIIAIAMLAAIVGFIIATWKTDRIAALLFLPYAGWVSFATYLNASLAYLN